LFGLGIIHFFALPFSKTTKQRGVRVVEGARLESVYTREGIEGSNPFLSAEIAYKTFKFEESIIFQICPIEAKKLKKWI
jgi:hypothetical protein